MSNKFLYFAYGSDMSLPQMRGRMLDAEVSLPDDARRSARLSGYRLSFERAVPNHDAIGHANLHAEAEGVVQGVLYELPESALAVLDRFEGVAEGLSQRITVQVTDDNGEQSAIAYVAGTAWVREGLKPSRNHLYRLLSAQRYLDVEYFAHLQHTESLKIPVDDEGMPHGSRRKVQRDARQASQNTASESSKAPAPPKRPIAPRVSSQSDKPRTDPSKAYAARKAQEPARPAAESGEDKPKKKKHYPAVGEYAPKSARAFRKAFGIAPKKEGDRNESAGRSEHTGRGDSGNRSEAPRRPSPWAGRGSSETGKSRSDNRDYPRGGERRGGSDRRETGRASHDRKPGGGKGRGRPW